MIVCESVVSGVDAPTMVCDEVASECVWCETVEDYFECCASVPVVDGVAVDDCCVSPDRTDESGIGSYGSANNAGINTCWLMSDHVELERCGSTEMNSVSRPEIRCSVYLSSL